MITVPPGVRVLVWSAPVDFRRGMDSLAALVQVTLRLDPFAGDVFVFRSRRSDRVKLLLYDGTGLILITKRLEAGRFKWPPVTDGVVRLSALQLSVRLALGAFAGVADFPPKGRLLRGKCRPDWLAQV
jgi:transposase